MNIDANANSKRRTCRLICPLLACVIVLLCSPTHAQYPPADLKKNPFLLGVPVDLSVPEPPVAFQGTDRKFHLAYELHLTNFSKADLMLKQLEVLDDSTGNVLANYSSSGLKERLRSLASSTPSQSLPEGSVDVVFIWLDFTSPDVPRTLKHRLQVFAPVFPRQKVQVVEGGSTQVAEEARVIGPPLRGGGWYAANGPSNDSHHRRTLIAVGGRARIPERFATDWAREENGELLKGDSSKNSNYFGYGAEVLAVADATVVYVLDGVPENRGDAETRTAPITLKNIGGNCVILDIGQHQFAFYAHLQPHSIRVNIGDHVNRGQALALVGNSGNATGPHLHFQISDANSELATEGLPFVFDSVELVGRASDDEKFTPLPHPRELSHVLPLEDDVVRFP